MKIDIITTKHRERAERGPMLEDEAGAADARPG